MICPMNATRAILRWLAFLTAALLLAGLAQPVVAQPARPKGPMPRPAPMRPPHAERGPKKPPSKEQIEKHLERVKRRATERRAKREQRQRARRKALRSQLQRLLAGGPITGAIRDELRTHARRIAQLRRIREIAAEKDDYDMVIRIDKLIGRENARYDKWLRDLPRKQDSR